MSNPQKGEVLVQIDVGEFTLAYTLGAVAAIEGQFPGQNLQAILADLDGDAPKLHTLMVVIWAGLKKHHNLTLSDVGDLVALPDVPVWGAKLAEAFKLAQPEAKGKARPPKAAAN